MERFDPFDRQADVLAEATRMDAHLAHAVNFRCGLVYWTNTQAVRDCMKALAEALRVARGEIKRLEAQRSECPTEEGK